MSTQKRENLWNQLLFENSRAQKYTNKTVIVLGRPGAGKRTLIDSLTEISKTNYPKLTQQSGKLSVKGVTPLLDYTYLNVIDLNDPDFATNARLNVYILEEESQKELLLGVLNPKTIKETVVVLALDMQEPWTFMEDLDQWIGVLQDVLQQLNLSLGDLEDMKLGVEQYIRDFYGIDPDAKNLPLREGVLDTNMGLPIVVVVNKSDILERDDKGKDWDSKQDAIKYSLRQMCINYGGTLLFTSVKSKINLETFYQYILHRLYRMPLLDKSDTTNMEALFIPVGSDDMSILKSIMQKQAAAEYQFSDVVQPMLNKKSANKEEITVEDDQEFFSKLKDKSTTATTNKPAINQISLKNEPVPEDNNSAPTSARGAQNPQLQDFYNRILHPQKGEAQNPQPAQQSNEKEKAQSQLYDRLKMTKSETVPPNALKNNPLFNAEDKAKIQNIIKTVQPQDSARSSEATRQKFQNILQNRDKQTQQ